MAKKWRLSLIFTKHRLRFLGHISRMDESRLPKQLLVCAPVSGSRAASGQKYRRNDLVLKDLRRCGLSEGWREYAQNRRLWQQVICRSVRSCDIEAEQEEKDARMRGRS